MTNIWIVGIITSITAMIITYVVWYIWGHYRQRDNLISLLGIKGTSQTRVFYGNIVTVKLAEVQKDAHMVRTTLAYGDITATLLIYDRLKSTYLGKVEHSIGNYPNLVTEGNVVSIGGPRWNKVTEFLLGRLGSPLYFEKDFEGIVEKRKSHTSENIHTPTIESFESGNIKIHERGFVICGRDCFVNPNLPSATIVAGYSTFGVLVAAQYLANLSGKELKELKARTRNDKRFCLLIEGEIEIDESMVTAHIENPTLIMLIPEQDFLEPYSFSFSWS